MVWCGVVWCGVVWCGVVWCGVVWCGVVWCGVVWCAGGAVIDRQWPECVAHGKMQNGWVLIFNYKSNCVLCLLGARCPAVGRRPRISCSPPPDSALAVFWGFCAVFARGGASASALRRPMRRTGCSGPRLAAAPVLHLTPFLCGGSPHLPRHGASGPCKGFETLHTLRAVASPIVQHRPAVGSAHWRLLLFTIPQLLAVGSGVSFCSLSHRRGQWAAVAPCVHGPTAMGSGPWWILPYAAPLLWAASSADPSAHCRTAMGSGQC